MNTNPEHWFVQTYYPVSSILKNHEINVTIENTFSCSSKVREKSLRVSPKKEINESFKGHSDGLMFVQLLIA